MPSANKKLKLQGGLAVAQLPDDVQKQFRKRCRKILNRRRIPYDVVKNVTSTLIDELSWAYAGRDHQLSLHGAGRPPRGNESFLSIGVADILKAHGIRGNWLGCGDETEDGEPGLVAEIEAVALTALRQASDQSAPGVMARPARINDARKRLGKVEKL
jgi:hypothetical protein